MMMDDHTTGVFELVSEITLRETFGTKDDLHKALESQYACNTSTNQI